MRRKSWQPEISSVKRGAIANRICILLADIQRSTLESRPGSHPKLSGSIRRSWQLVLKMCHCLGQSFSKDISLGKYIRYFLGVLLWYKSRGGSMNVKYLVPRRSTKMMNGQFFRSSKAKKNSLSSLGYICPTLISHGASLVCGRIGAASAPSRWVEGSWRYWHGYDSIMPTADRFE